MTASRLKTFTIYIVFGAIFLLLLSPLYMYFSHDVEKLNTYYPHATILDSSISLELKEGKPKGWVTLKEISKYGVMAIVLSEDWGFYQHQGIDHEQMKAALQDMWEIKRFRGASTISQQMVKNVYLSEDRTLWRKIHELILTQKAENVLSKKRILEIYLNCIEFGPGIYGIRNASFHYFKKHPSGLNPKEGAFLAMLLPSPKRYYISFKKKKLTSFARSRVEAILIKMRMGKVISHQEYRLQNMNRLSWEK
jgi:monofunctional biosynthetic peptidoglycan transglycosylase